jgi:pimeloyl-ACP methyl ester carboxylesterase
MNTRLINVNGGQLAVSDYGEKGPPVVMVPGMGALREEYRFLAPSLSDEGFRCIAMDVRGHGESSVPWDDYDVPSVGRDILAVADSSDEDGVHLVGTSKAAGAVVWAAAERPDKVRSVVLIGPFVHADKTPFLMKTMFWLLMHNPWRVRSWTGYYRSLFPSRKPDDFEDYLARLAGSLRGEGRIEAAYQFGRADLEEADARLRQLSMPVLVVMGTNDPDFADPATEAQRTARESGGEVRMIDGAGHYPQTEMPEAANPAIVEFIKRCA